MARKIDTNLVDDAVGEAFTEKVKQAESKGKKRKTITIDIDTEERIKKNYNGTISGYIAMAIFNQMKADGF